LPPSDEHGADNRRDIGAVFQKNFNLPIKSQAPHRAWQQTESLEHSSDVVGQSGRHADESSPRAEKRARAMAVERLDVNRPEPAGSDDLSQSLRVVLIRLIDLHLEGGAGVPSVETNDFKSESAEFMCISFDLI
jgi:hypothetical protein